MSIEQLGNCDAFVMGRVTYEKFFANWGHIAGNPYIDCPELEAAGQVREFAKLMTHRRGHRLEAWITTATTAGGDPHLAGFAVGLRRDQAAVTAGLTLPYSSGAVEGTVNKVKMIKRKMFGRARFDLLRKLVLLG